MMGGGLTGYAHTPRPRQGAPSLSILIIEAWPNPIDNPLVKEVAYAFPPDELRLNRKYVTPLRRTITCGFTKTARETLLKEAVLPTAAA